MEDFSKDSKKLTVHYAAAFFVYFSAFCMIRSFIAVYLTDRGFSYTQVGIITAVHTFCTAVIQPNFSLILNRLPKITLKQFISLCCIPSIFCSVLVFIVPAKMIVFLPIYILLGFFEIGLHSLMVSLGMEFVNAGVPINPGIGRGFGSVGYAAANIVLGGLIVKYGSPVSHKLNIALMILLFILLMTLPDPQSFEKGSNKRESGFKPADALGSFLRNNLVFAMFVLSVIFIFFGHCIVNTYMPNVAAQFGLGSDFVGWMNGLAAGLELIPMVLYVRISKKISPFYLLYSSAVFFSVKMFTALMAQSGTGIAISQTMQFFAYAQFAMSSIYFANRAVEPHNRVMAQGLLVGANEAGFMIGGLVGGLVLDHGTIRVLLGMGLASTLIGSVLMIIAVRQYQKSAGNS